MTKEENKKIVEKFPFLLPRNRYTGAVVPDYDYSYTEYDAMPEGWRKAFGIKMCEEIQKELDKSPSLKEQYCITQIKEKYGSLRWYSNFYTTEIEKIIQRYENISKRTCICCGAPATKISTGWISPYCNKCAEKDPDEGYVPVDEYYD